MVQIPLEELVSMKETIIRMDERLKTIENSRATRTMRRSMAKNSVQSTSLHLAHQPEVSSLHPTRSSSLPPLTLRIREEHLKSQMPSKLPTIREGEGDTDDDGHACPALFEGMEALYKSLMTKPTHRVLNYPGYQITMGKWIQ